MQLRAKHAESLENATTTSPTTTTAELITTLHQQPPDGIDLLQQLPVLQITNLLDGNASVTLTDMMPRIVPIGRNAEAAIVAAARVSTTGAALTAIDKDQRLVNYLVAHEHTSPLEHVSFTFLLKIPDFVAKQILRHRTGAYNEESQRYRIVREIFYRPSRDQDAFRAQNIVGNKQGSHEVKDNEQWNQTAKSLLCESETVMEKSFDIYRRLVEHGVAREVARSCLPKGTYTELMMTMNLNNLRRFFRLRCDEHAQRETRVIACAMFDLIQPLVPSVLKSPTVA
jgi:thymidylate synthase (FAD)